MPKARSRMLVAPKKNFSGNFCQPLEEHLVEVPPNVRVTITQRQNARITLIVITNKETGQRYAETIVCGTPGTTRQSTSALTFVMPECRSSLVCETYYQQSGQDPTGPIFHWQEM